MENFLAIFLFAVATMLTPGPNNFMLMSSGLHYGAKRSIPHLLGVCLGFPIMIVILASGFGVIFIKFAFIKYALKIFGAGYLLYLAYKIMNSTNNVDNPSDANPMTFVQALLFQWVNPKGLLTAISAISLYTVSTHYFYSVFYMSMLFFLVCLPSAGVWLFMGMNIRKYLKSDNHRKIFNFVMAAALIASVGMIFFE